MTFYCVKYSLIHSQIFDYECTMNENLTMNENIKFKKKLLDKFYHDNFINLHGKNRL